MIQEAPAQGSVSDPARQIGGWVSYNVDVSLALYKPFLIDLKAAMANKAEVERHRERLNRMALFK
jgi:hypothetical protein